MPGREQKAQHATRVPLLQGNHVPNSRLELVIFDSARAIAKGIRSRTMRGRSESIALVVSWQPIRRRPSRQRDLAAGWRAQATTVM